MTKNAICGVLESLRKLKLKTLIYEAHTHVTESDALVSHMIQNSRLNSADFLSSVTRCSLVDHHLKESVTPSVAGMMGSHVTSVKTRSSPPFNKANSSSPRPSFASARPRSLIWYVTLKIVVFVFIPDFFRSRVAYQRMPACAPRRPRSCAIPGLRKLICAAWPKSNQTYPLPHFKTRSSRAHKK